MTSDDGLPALFHQRPEKGKQGIILLSHADDMELHASRKDFSQTCGISQKQRLEDQSGRTARCKRRTNASLENRIPINECEGDVEITMNSKHIEGLVEVLKPQEEFSKKIPCPSDNGRSVQARKHDLTPLSAEEHQGVGILLYLAPERPDIMCVLKKLSTKLAGPTGSDMESLRYLGKYLQGMPDLALMHQRSFPGKSFLKEEKQEHGERNPCEQQSVLEMITDSD